MSSRLTDFVDDFDADGETDEDFDEFGDDAVSQQMHVNSFVFTFELLGFHLSQQHLQRLLHDAGGSMTRDEMS